MRLPIQIQGILFKTSTEKIQYLLLKRTQDRQGFWQPVTGGLEEGETKVEALKREVREETGIRNIIQVIENDHYFEYSDPYPISEYVFGAKVSPNVKVVIDKREHSEFRWCSLKEALDLLKWEENKEALIRLNQMLNVET